uniref:NR LBD domain-containing protein n=1 Tax=Acrobeloides nanus TaxID=290746 RepID=A0A914DQL7_9BILA
MESLLKGGTIIGEQEGGANPLPPHWLLYKHAWLIFFKIERYYSTIQTFGTSFNDFRIMYNDTLVLDFNNPDNTIKDVYPQHYEQWKSLWYPIRDKYFKCIVNPMKSLQISRFELIYVLAQILWSATDITGLSEKANRVAEDISDQISNELHDHYVHERHLTNYASRLTKLNKIISATEVRMI